MGMNPGATTKDGSQVLCKSAISSVNASFAAMLFGPFPKGTIVAGLWLHGNTATGYTPTAVMARGLRQSDGADAGSVATVADGPDLLGGNAVLDTGILGGVHAGCPVLLAERSYYPLNVEIDEFPFIMVYVGGTGIASNVTCGIVTQFTRKF